VIELAMVRRMIKRGLLLAVPTIVVLGLIGGPPWALSAAIGIALTLGNLWLAGRIIGGLAENAPQMLMVGGMGAMFVGLAVLTVVALGLKQVDYLSFPVTGITLLAVHVVVVTWEAAVTLLKLPSADNARDKELVHGA
jgi:hypothetical protein